MTESEMKEIRDFAASLSARRQSISDKQLLDEAGAFIEKLLLHAESVPLEPDPAPSATEPTPAPSTGEQSG